MPTNRFFRGTGLALILLLCIGTHVSVVAQDTKNFLEIPVKLEVEKGDLNDVVIKVRKDGKDAFTQSGASKMRFKLDFSRKYTLIFTKPGYITKTIEVNTNAPATRISQGFEPYKIGVKLFKQSDDDHKVVYNQPVARIKFDENLDEFNFDTDYSKSILSAMQGKKDKNSEELQTGVTVDPTPETPATASAGTDPVPAIAGTFTASTETTPATPSAVTGKDETPEPSPVNHEKEASTASTAQEQAAPKPAAPVAEKETPSTAQVIAGEEQSHTARPVSGEEETTTKTEKSTSKHQPIAEVSENSERPKVQGIPISGTDTNPVSQTITGGNDTPTPEGFIPESEHITREDIVEKNRVIVLVRITQGAKVTQYSKVQYNWGGRYFFKDNSTSITETAFAYQTGIQP